MGGTDTGMLEGKSLKVEREKEVKPGEGGKEGEGWKEERAKPYRNAETLPRGSCPV